MSEQGTEARHRGPSNRSGRVSVVVPNRLPQQLIIAGPNQASVSDITHIRTRRPVVLDLYCRQVIEWPLRSRIKKELVLDAWLIAMWRGKPTTMVTVYSDQRSQYMSHDWQNVLQANNLQGSMNRDGNCHNHAVVERFFCSNANGSGATSTQRGMMLEPTSSNTLIRSTTTKDDTVSMICCRR